MGIVTRRGEHRLADPDTARGAGRDSLYSPLRGMLDYSNPLSAIDDTVGQAGGQIGGAIDGAIDDVVAFIKETTGIDLTSIATLLEMPIDVLGATPLGKVLDVLGMFLPFLPGSDPATFDPTSGAESFISLVLNPTNLLASTAQLQEVFNTAWDAIVGSEEGLIDRTAAEFAFALKNIPALNVIGVGAATLVDTVTDLLDSFWRGFSRTAGTGKSAADVANVATVTANAADTATQIAEWNNAVLGIRNNKGLMQGMDETEESNFLLSELMDGAADPPIISATASSVPMAFWRATESSLKGFISWFGRGIANVTGLFIDVYRFNPATSTLELLHSSPDQIGAMGAAWSLGIYNIAVANRVQVNAGDVIGVAWRVTGTGTHSLAGRLAPWLPDHPTVHPKKPAAVRAGGVGNIAYASIVYSSNVPWFGIGILSGDVPPSYFAPRTTQYTTAGTYTYEIPLSATHVDVVLAGAGGGGQGGSTFSLVNGEGGDAGVWVAETLVRGTHFPSNATELTITVGAGGGGGGAGSVAGGAGGASSRAAIAGGKAALSAPGGLGGDAGNNSNHTGDSPGDYLYNDVTYVGGIGLPAVGGKTGRPGGSPGAGGAGGSGGTWGVGWAGGDGGRGGAWLVARQDLTVATIYAAAFGLAVPVAFGITAAPRQVGSFGLSVPVAFGMTGAGRSTAAFALDVPVAFGIAAALSVPGAAAFALNVPVGFGMAGVEHYVASFGLSVPVAFGITAAARQVGSFALDVPIAFGMTGAGTVTPASYDWLFSGTTKPAGGVDFGENNVTTVSGGTMQEGTTKSSVNGTYYSAWLYPSAMNTSRYTARANSAALQSGTSRGIGVCVAADDTPTKAVIGIMSQTTAAGSIILSWDGTAWTQRAAATGTGTSVGTSDDVGIRISESGGIYTYTLQKNQVDVTPTVAWTDSTGIIGVPGKRWGPAFKRIRASGVQSASPGVDEIWSLDT